MVNNCDRCGNCSRCGECCAAMLPLTKKEVKVIREYIEKFNIEPEFFKKNNDMNLNCCFYDRENKKCKIYDVRPHICRTYKCNRNENKLLQERNINQRNSYWNKMDENGNIYNITDMRLLFYNDPRSLIFNILYVLSDGTMEINKKQFEFMKKILIVGGQEELAISIEGEYKDE